MIEYLRGKWQLWATIGGLAAIVLALALVFGGSQTASAPAGESPPASPANPSPDSSGDDPSSPGPDNQQPPAADRRPQSFAVQIGNFELELTLLGFNCQPLSELAAQFVGDQTPAEIQAGFEKYEQGLSTLPQDEAWELYDIAGALDYMLNLKNHLGQTEPGTPIDSGSIYQSLGQYQQCVVSLAAKNQGGDSVFGSGCGLDIDDYAAGSNGQSQRFEPLYLGPAIACTEAEVPFLNGDTTQVQVVFSLPLATEITSLTIVPGPDGPESVVFDLAPGGT